MLRQFSRGMGYFVRVGQTSTYARASKFALQDRAEASVESDSVPLPPSRVGKWNVCSFPFCLLNGTLDVGSDGENHGYDDFRLQFADRARKAGFARAANLSALLSYKIIDGLAAKIDQIASEITKCGKKFLFANFREGLHECPADGAI
jgi:hypothetical protein